MKLALVLSVIDPIIGGVLIMGHRGTGKSTAVRALADLLPEISIARECRYRCDPADESNLCSDCRLRLASGEKLTRARKPVPIVDLPLGATEDRVCGTIDIERALKDGVKSFEPGLLARANRGFLYIDEVNLLEDHLVDLLLDVAATGWNKVERESISIEHPAQFVLIGSGNPEEGELRPQLLDRFGLHVEVKTENDVDLRVEIVERRQAFESDPAKFSASVVKDQQQLRNRITRAQKTAGKVETDRALLRQIAQLCTLLQVDGHRGELTIARAARSLAAFKGRRKVTEEEIRQVAVMALRHRLRRDPLEETASAAPIQQALEKVFFHRQRDREGWSEPGGGLDGVNGASTGTEGVGRASGAGRDRARRQSASPNGNLGQDSEGQLSPPEAPDVGLPYPIDNDWAQTEQRGSRSSRTSKPGGDRTRNAIKRTSLNYEHGRYARAVTLKRSGARFAIDATLRALAVDGCQLPSAGHYPSPTPEARHPTSVRAPDTRHPAPVHTLRYKQLARKNGRLFILLIDASGSMALNRIRQAKGAALSLLKDSYVKRDRVAIVGFRGESAEVLLAPSRSILRARRVLDSLGVGGGTPLAAGLLCSLEVSKRAQTKGGEIVLLLFTDGHANVSLQRSRSVDRAQRQQVVEQEVIGLGLALRKAGVRALVVDTQDGFVSSGNARELASNLGGAYVTCKRLSTAVAGAANC